MKKTHSIFIGLLIAGIISIPLFFSSYNGKQANDTTTNKSVKAASSTTVSFSANPTANANLPIGQFDITIRLNTNGNDIAGIEMVLKSSSTSTLELTGFTPAVNPIPNYPVSFTTISNQQLSGGEMYRYAAVNPTNSVFTGDINGNLTLGTLHAQMKKIGTANLLVETNSSVITNSTTPISVANAGGFIGTYTVPAPPTVTPVPPTTTPIPQAGAPTNFQISCSGNNALLSWTTPANAQGQSYQITYNGHFPTSTTTSYTLPLDTNARVNAAVSVRLANANASANGVINCPINAATPTTPPPAATATTVPAGQTATTAPTCVTKAQGNASQDCTIDTQDYDIWSREAKREVGTKEADFNGDGKVDILDFNIWRIGLFNINATKKK